MPELVFLDFEASSLSADSWPIEIGLSWINDGEVETWSSLIRPRPEWDLTDWSDRSAAVHGIPLAEVLDAPPADEVVIQATKLMGEQLILSDAPDFESHWLRRLWGEKATVPVVRSLFETSFSLMSNAGLDAFHERLATSRAPHRAGPDSARLARAWLRGINRDQLAL